MNPDNLSAARGCATATMMGMVAWAVVLLTLTSCGCASGHRQVAGPREIRYVPGNLDELDLAAERRLVSRSQRKLIEAAESVDAGAQLQAGPEVVW